MIDRPLIFASYASPDQSRVEGIVAELAGRGFNLWMDKLELLPGQNWDFEIKKALDRSDMILIFISLRSIEKRGYVQREIKDAIDKKKEKLVDDIYIIPIRLDPDASIPEELRHLQVIDFTGIDSVERIGKSIQKQSERVGKQAQTEQEQSEIKWFERTCSESWEGAPGYEFEFNWYELHSDKFPKISDITTIVRGSLTEVCARLRDCKTESQNDHLTFADAEFLRTSSFQAHSLGPEICGGMLSLVYSIHQYNAGAAHPIHGWDTYVFSLSPVFRIHSPQEIFEDEESAFLAVQRFARSDIVRQKREAIENDEYSESDDMFVEEGTQSWEDFQSFSLSNDTINFHFGSYHVGSYADGSFEVNVPYREVEKYLKSFYVSSLGRKWKLGT